MNLKISLFTLVIMVVPFQLSAQSARNPLNFEPEQMALKNRFSLCELSEEIFYRADGTPLDMRSFLYDEGGRKTMELTLKWSMSDNAFHQTEQCDYSFETNKVVVVKKLRERFETKTETIYDTGGKPVYSLTYRWNNKSKDWSVQSYLRCEWVYDSNGRITACLKQYKNSESDTWGTYKERIVYYYDISGDLVEELFQSRVDEDEKWTDRGKYSYENVGDRQKVALSFFWASSNWISDGKTVYLYDGDGKIVRCEYYKNGTDDTLHAWSAYAYTERKPLPDILESVKVNISPNPAVSFIVLSVPDEYVGKIIQLFDVWGKLVKTVQIAEQTMQIDVTGLPRGIYLLKTGNLSKKMILK